jgi:hypothetical protein
MYIYIYDICISKTNRQIQALSSTVGRYMYIYIYTYIYIYMYTHVYICAQMYNF